MDIFFVCVNRQKEKDLIFKYSIMDICFVCVSRQKDRVVIEILEFLKEAWLNLLHLIVINFSLNSWSSSR